MAGAGASRDEAGGALALVLGAGSPLGLSDGALVERFAARPGSAAGEAAFAALVARHGAMVRRVCHQTLRSDADADDAYQAVWLVLARRAGAIREPDLLAPWLYGVALRTARLARRRRRVGIALATEPVAAGSEGCPVEATESAEALHAEVARLPEAQRRAVVLCHLEGLTHDEAARRLGVPTGTVSVRLMRARERLRDRLTRRGFAPGGPLFPALARDGTTLPPRAWAALSHLRGQPAGEVPAGVASLASGALPMIAPISKIAAVALLATGLAATGAWSLAQSPTRPDPTQSPATSKVDAPPNLPDNPPLTEFRRVYRLEPGQIVKRIPPPFADWRTAELETRTPQVKEHRPRLMSLIYEEHGGTLTCVADSYSNPPRPPAGEIDSVAKCLLGKRFLMVEGPSEAQETQVAGDWVFRASATSEERIAALNVILAQECHLPIRVRFGLLERETVVARGWFQPRPLLEGDEAIQIYGAKIRASDRRVHSGGDFLGFLADVGMCLSPQRSVIDETTGRPAHLTWEAHLSASIKGQAHEAVHDPALVLRHVAEQTGLTFTTEQRRVPVLTIERVE